jgi:hypothetical protein
MKYRKTALIEATQWNKMGDHPQVYATGDSSTGFALHTLENPKGHEVTPGDWIAGPGPKGEFWAIKPDVFAATYERADTEKEKQ